ncbi:MAG: T9SS type A sorting domain-containing protein, partial [Flavobacteriales bacterium]
CSNSAQTTVHVNPLLVEENDLFEELIIYPNPSRTSFTLKFICKSPGQVKMKISNTLEQTVLERILTTNNCMYTGVFNIEDYARGVYNLSIVTETGIINRRLVFN